MPSAAPRVPGVLADPAEADDAEGGAGEVTDRDGAAVGPPAGADQVGQPAEPLDQVHGHRDGTLGDRDGAGARGDHDGDTAGGGGVQVDAFDADTGPGDDPQPRGPVEEGGVDDGVGAGDGALRLAPGRLGRVRDEPAPTGEDRRRPGPGSTTPSPTTSGRSGSDIGRHDRRSGGRRWRPGTCGTLCHCPSTADAAAAAITSASARASSMVELRCSPPVTATRNFLASMTLRSS